MGQDSDHDAASVYGDRWVITYLNDAGRRVGDPWLYGSETAAADGARELPNFAGREPRVSAVRLIPAPRTPTQEGARA